MANKLVLLRLEVLTAVRAEHTTGVGQKGLTSQVHVNLAEWPIFNLGAIHVHRQKNNQDALLCTTTGDPGSEGGRVLPESPMDTSSALVR